MVAVYNQTVHWGAAAAAAAARRASGWIPTGALRCGGGRCWQVAVPCQGSVTGPVPFGGLPCSPHRGPITFNICLCHRKRKANGLPHGCLMRKVSDSNVFFLQTPLFRLIFCRFNSGKRSQSYLSINLFCTCWSIEVCTCVGYSHQHYVMVSGWNKQLV